MTPFHFACKYGESAVSDDQIFQKLIDKMVESDKGQTILTSKDSFGMTGLHYAATKGNYKDVMHLLDKMDTKDYSIDETNKHGDSALLVAAKEGNKDVVDLILRKGGSFDITNLDGMNIVLSAAFCGQLYLLKDLQNEEKFMSCALKKNKKGNSLLHLSVASGSLDTVNWVLEEIPGLLERQNKIGNTPIHYASKKNLPNILHLLLQYKPEKDAMNKENKTALMIGAENGHDKIVKELIAVKADLNLKDQNSNTALLLASAKGHQTMVEILLESGAELDTKNKHHKNILHVASAGGNTNILQIILEKIENASMMEYKDLNDENPFHIAAKNTNSDFVKILLESRKVTNKYSNNILIFSTLLQI